eukprot:6176672-Pleurochrysis_carterae.AAC.1
MAEAQKLKAELLKSAKAVNVETTKLHKRYDALEKEKGKCADAAKLAKTELQNLRAAAAAELHTANEKATASLDEQMKASEKALSSLQAQLQSVRESLPASQPKAHTEAEFDALSYNGQATARHRDM